MADYGQLFPATVHSTLNFLIPRVQSSKLEELNKLLGRLSKNRNCFFSNLVRISGDDHAVNFSSRMKAQ